MRAVLQLFEFKLPLLVLLLVGVLPRIGCVSSDGTRLPYCQKFLNGAFTSLMGSTHSAPREKGCSCCEERRVDHGPCRDSDSESSCPCDCQVTFDGPEWSATDSVDSPQLSLIPFELAAISSDSLKSSTRSDVRVLVEQHLLPQCIAQGAVRLNI